MLFEDFGGPVQTLDISLDQIWNSIPSIKQANEKWSHVTEAQLEGWFVKSGSEIKVNCDVERRGVSSCTILPSRDERYNGLTMTRCNACIQFRFKGGGLVETEFTSSGVIGISKTLGDLLKPEDRPCVPVPERIVVEKINLKNDCESMDQILDFIAYYELKPEIRSENAGQIKTIWFKSGELAIKVQPALDLRSGYTAAMIVSYKRGLYVSHVEFKTGRDLINALVSVGIPVNEAITHPTPVTRLKSQFSNSETCTFNLKSTLSRIEDLINFELEFTEKTSEFLMLGR